MSENTVKVRLKFGQLEIDYEGPIPFLKNDLSVLIEEMAGFCKDHRSHRPLNRLHLLQRSRSRNHLMETKMGDI